MSDEIEPIELEIPLVEIPARPEPPAVVPPSTYLVAPQPPPRPHSILSTRDCKAAGLGALVLGLVAALAWFSRPAPRVG